MQLELYGMKECQDLFFQRDLLSRKQRRQLDRQFARQRQIVGPVYGADGTTPATGRQCKTGEAAVASAHGKYYEAASRGAIFAAADQGVGVTVQVTITTTAALALYNPRTSQKRIAINKLAISYFTGTLGAGSFYHGFNPVGTTLPSGGTALTANCTDIGNQSAPTAVGVAISGATVVAGTVLYPFGSSFASTAAITNPPCALIEDVDGAIVLEPGGIYQLLGVFGGTGSTPKISVGILWEEFLLAGSQG